LRATQRTASAKGKFQVSELLLSLRNYLAR
jgi:hypothetical protein